MGRAVGLQFKWAWNWGTGQDNTATENLLVEIGQKQTEVVEQAYEMAKFLNGLVMAPQSLLPKMAWAFYRGK